MTDKSIYDFSDYKAYLKAMIKAQPGGGHGFRSRMAEALNCQTAYISQVLNGKAHLSLEQAEAANLLFAHGEEEAQYFLLIVERGRAGTPALIQRLDRQIQAILKRRLLLRERMSNKVELDEKHQMKFYSSWIYSAISVVVTIPEIRTKQAISEALHLPMQQVSEALEFLLQTGLLRLEDGEYVTGEATLFLGSDSPMIAQHHTNWRLQAMKSFDRPSHEDLHYSGVVTLAASDVRAIKDRLIQALNETRKQIIASKEEEIHVIALDFFKL